MNRISDILDRVEQALAAPVAAGDLAAVVRGVIQPLTVAAAPTVGLAVSRLARSDGSIWTADVLVQLACDSTGGAAEEVVIDAVAVADGAIKALADSGQSGGKIDGPTWDLWYVPVNDGRLARVGAIGGLRITIDGPLTA